MNSDFLTKSRQELVEWQDTIFRTGDDDLPKIYNRVHVDLIPLPVAAVENIVTFLKLVRVRPGMYMGDVTRRCMWNLYYGLTQGFELSWTDYPHALLYVVVKDQGYEMSGGQGVEHAIVERFPDFTEEQVVDAMLAIYIGVWETYLVERNTTPLPD